MGVLTINHGWLDPEKFRSEEALGLSATKQTIPAPKALQPEVR